MKLSIKKQLLGTAVIIGISVFTTTAYAGGGGENDGPVELLQTQTMAMNPVSIARSAPFILGDEDVEGLVDFIDYQGNLIFELQAGLAELNKTKGAPAPVIPSLQGAMPTTGC